MHYDGFTSADVDRAGQLALRLRALPVLLAGAAQHAVAGRGHGDAAGRLRPRHRPAGHQDQARRRRSPHALLPARTSPRRSRPRWPSPSCSTPAPARSTSILGELGLPAPGWFNDPAWSKPALTLLALWGIGDLMVIFMAALLDVPKEQYEAAELDGAGAWQRFRYVTLPNISPIVMFAVVTGVIQTMQYYTQPLVAGKVASGVIGGSGQQFEPGYPDEVDADPAAARLQPRLPALRHRLRLRRRARAVRAGDGVHRAADAPPQRPAGVRTEHDGRRRRSPRTSHDQPPTRLATSDAAQAAGRKAIARVDRRALPRRRRRRCSSCCRSSSSS